MIANKSPFNHFSKIKLKDIGERASEIFHIAERVKFHSLRLTLSPDNTVHIMLWITAGKNFHYLTYSRTSRASEQTESDYCSVIEQRLKIYTRNHIRKRKKSFSFHFSREYNIVRNIYIVYCVLVDMLIFTQRKKIGYYLWLYLIKTAANKKIE